MSVCYLENGENMKYSNQEIQEIIPHRYPFLLVDRIIDGEEGKWATGIKNVTANEWFFQGHFPNYPVMPGVLIIESLAQVGATVILGIEDNKGKIAFFGGVKNAKFKRQVTPGDVLNLRCELVRMKANVGIGKATATVDGEVCCSCEMTFIVK